LSPLRTTKTKQEETQAYQQQQNTDMLSKHNKTTANRATAQPTNTKQQQTKKQQTARYHESRLVRICLGKTPK